MTEYDEALEILELEKFIREGGKYDGDMSYTPEQVGAAWELARAALCEKRDRESAEQWLDDMNNPLEPIKVRAALDSEIMKYNFRREHCPQDVSVLDGTIIAALKLVLAAVKDRRKN